MRRLVNGTSKRKREARWAAVNRQRLLLLRLCVDRALSDQLYSPSEASPKCRKAHAVFTKAHATSSNNAGGLNEPG
jgi:hypothetical protein